MKKILLVPLDDRPVNTEDPRWMGRLVEETIQLPPHALLGKFTRPGNPEKILTWLSRNLPAACAVIVSIDMITYGGLIASRTMATPFKGANARLHKLFQLIQHHPNTPFYLFSILSLFLIKN